MKQDINHCKFVIQTDQISSNNIDNIFYELEITRNPRYDAYFDFYQFMTKYSTKNLASLVDFYGPTLKILKLLVVTPILFNTSILHEYANKNGISLSSEPNELILLLHIFCEFNTLQEIIIHKFIV